MRLINRFGVGVLSAAITLVLGGLLPGIASADNAAAQPVVGQEQAEVLGGSTGDATGASAGPRRFLPGSGWDGCLPGEMCLFVHVNGGGGGFAWGANGATGDFRTLLCAPSQQCNGFNATFDDDASSWWNRTGQHFCVSDGYWGGNPDNTTPIGTRGNFTPSWQDRAGSLGYLECP